MARKSAAARREEIVETVLQLAGEVGPDRLTTMAIAAEIGITQPAIFRHFPTKQDLWTAIAARIGEQLEERWSSAERSGSMPAQRLRTVVAAQLTLIRSTPAIPAILFSRELHAENDALRRGFHDLLQRFHRLLMRTIDEGRAAGEFRADLNPRDSAYLVIGLIQGLALRWSLSGRAFDIDTEGEQLLTLLMKAFEAPSAAREGRKS